MLAVLGMLVYGLAFICAIVSLVFFVMVLIQMFNHDESTMGIICIVLTFCTGIGPLIAFIYGWTKADEWDMKKTMKNWTIAFVLQIVLGVIAVGLMFGAAATADPGDFQMDPGSMDLEIDMEDGEFGMPDGDFGVEEGGFSFEGTDNGAPEAPEGFPTEVNE